MLKALFGGGKVVNKQINRFPLDKVGKFMLAKPVLNVKESSVSGGGDGTFAA